MTDTQDLITVDTDAGAITPGQLWRPVEGEETARMLGRLALDPDERRTLVAESISILGRCTDPADVAPSRRAGLVVGAVQSGKTLSFTTVAALARDNGYQLVVLVAGTKENLLEQSRDRLADDLDLRSGEAHYRWIHRRSPKPGGTDAINIAADLRHILDGGSRREDVPTLLITVMKNHRHMADAAAVLRQVADQVELDRVTALVIDDEADQATPNLRRTGESATYRNLREIRDALPRHSLLEYTATPQAPLLVSLADEISPDFTCVLTPGRLYAGGRYFFAEHRDTFLNIIPTPDLACLDDPSLGPPQSVLDALAVFFVGAAAAQLDPTTRRVAQRSMLVHPSQKTIPHAAFRAWIEAARGDWAAVLDEGGHDAADLIRDTLRPAYDNLARSVANIAAWPDVLARLPSLMSRTRIEEVNARGGRSRTINWSEAYAWILVGGALMDRGFTVEGLTVTYMPRGVGVGNADTLQQRARFFGYKRSYGAYCRAWLEADVADAFVSYVAHEETMRRELRRAAAEGEPLQRWRRRFLLDPGLRPTRQATIRLSLARFTLEDRWLQQWHVPLPPHDDDIVDANRRVVDALVADLDWCSDPVLSGSTEVERHDRAELALAELYERLIVEMVLVEDDHPRFLALALSIEERLDRGPDPGAVVYRMSRGISRARALDGDSTKLRGLMQGRSHDGSYAGDRSVHDSECLTVQLHTVDVRREAGGAILRPAVPFLAVWVPQNTGLEAALVEV